MCLQISVHYWDMSISLCNMISDACIGNGVFPSPFDCYLVNQGLSTLHVRMRQHQKNAFTVAKFLETLPLVDKVIYPGTHTQRLFVMNSVANG